MPAVRRLLTRLAAGAVLTLAACAPPRLGLPTGAATPFPEAATIYEDAIRACQGIRTFSATFDLSGRAGDQRLRGQIDAGFEAPDRVRLEMRAPFGRPVFILAAQARTRHSTCRATTACCPAPGHRRSSRRSSACRSTPRSCAPS
jgi:outer membrane biogenesis lipoprotein LolB